MQRLNAQTVLLPLIALGLGVFSWPAWAWVSVGQSPGFGSCDHTSVQAAIDSGENEIRILDNQSFQENLLITGSRTLRGGFTSCLAASLNQQQGDHAEIDGSGSSILPTVNIAMSGTGNITLEKLRITGGSTGVATGGLDGVLNIRNSLVAENGGFSTGGGVFIGNPGDTLQVVIENSSIIGNSATDSGGGIYCESDRANIRLQSGGILENISGGDGGGVYVTGGCNFSSYAGTRFDDGSVLAGVSFNSAVNEGGGIYAGPASTVIVSGYLGPLGAWGNTTDPATIANNTAGSIGGGIFATGSNTVVQIIDADIRGNDGGEFGGGAFVANGALLTSDLSGPDCWHVERCTRWRDNEVSTGVRYGGHVYAAGGVTVRLHRSYLSGGRAALGTAVYARTAGTLLDVEGSYFYDNGLHLPPGTSEQHVIRLLDGAEATLLHTTLGTNLSGVGSLGVSGSASLIDVQNSIVYNNNIPVLATSGGPAFNFDCTIGNESGSTAGAVAVLDPGFRDAPGGDLRLTPGSAAIDRCASAGATLDDTEHDPRGVDDPAVSNLAGLYDAGADEQALGDALFSDRFEP